MVNDESGACKDGKFAGVDCTEAVRQLYTYLDGELTEERRQGIAVHLDECGWCGDAADFEAELRALIANRCKDRVPDSLKARVVAALEEARRGEPGGDA